MANGMQTGTLESGGWFQIYKPTQGYWTRLFTAIGAGAFILWGASWIFNKLSVYKSTQYGLYIQVIPAVVFLVVLGYLLYWAVGRKPSTVDFFVSVEGEMKKVNWSSWPEVIGATKVVILFVVILSLMLFLVDTIFMLFFSSIGVLKGPGFMAAILGLYEFFKSTFGG